MHIPLTIQKAKSFKQKIIGLIGKKEPTALLIITRFGIHTFGLKFPIDVLVLDEENKIVKLKQNVQSNRIFFWNPKYTKIVELPQGIIKKKNIRIHDIIEFS